MVTKRFRMQRRVGINHNVADAIKNRTFIDKGLKSSVNLRKIKFHSWRLFLTRLGSLSLHTNTQTLHLTEERRKKTTRS